MPCRGAALQRHLLKIKKPKDPTECTVIAGFSGVRLSDSTNECCDKPGFRNHHQNSPVHCLKHLPNTHTWLLISYLLLSFSKGGRLVATGSGRDTSPAWMLHIWQPQPTGTSPLPVFGGKMGRTRGILSCWVLYKEQAGLGMGRRGVKIPGTTQEEPSPASRCRAS